MNSAAREAGRAVRRQVAVRVGAPALALGVGAAINIANGSLDIREGHYLSGDLQVVGGVFELGTIAKTGVVAAKAEVAAEQMGVRTAEVAAEEAGTASRNATNTLSESSGASSRCLEGVECFVAGTLVTMGDGSQKPIQQIRQGDLVMSRDEVSGKTEPKKVTSLSSHLAPATMVLTLSDGSHVECTPNHPFYVQGKGWTPARECGIGTSIVTRAGPSVQVKSVDRHERDETVFNLTVEDDHSFFVGTAGLWTHNASLKCPGLHHLAPMSMGNEIPRGNSALTYMNRYQHSKIHSRLEIFLRDETKPLPGGQTVDMFARNGNPGRDVIANFTAAEREDALRRFHTTYNNGEYLQRFENELAAAKSRGQWR